MPVTCAVAALGEECIARRLPARATAEHESFVTVIDRRTSSPGDLATADLPRQTIELIDGVVAPSAGLSVAIVGMGYVGLPTALSFHAAGADVVGVDISRRRIDDIERGWIDALPSDHQRLRRAMGSDRFDMTEDLHAITRSEAILICVPTPIDDRHKPDLGPLRAACRSVTAAMRRGQTVILTSTSYVGTTRDLLVEPLAARGLIAGRDVHVAFSPERIDPGNSSHPQETVPRVVGGATADCLARASDVLSGVTETIHGVSSLEAAELTKLYENTFRAVNIALANEVADLAGQHGLSINEVTLAAATKPYGFMPFYPGVGVGGHCIPCDPHYLIAGEEDGTTPVISAAMTVIHERPTAIADRAELVLARAGVALRGARVIVVGVAYKAGIRDIRESPAVDVLNILNGRGARVGFVDPMVGSVTLSDGTHLESIERPDEIRSDVVIVATLHPRSPTAWIRRQPNVIDPGEQLERFG